MLPAGPAGHGTTVPALVSRMPVMVVTVTTGRIDRHVDTGMITVSGIMERLASPVCLRELGPIIQVRVIESQIIQVMGPIIQVIA